MYIIFLCVIFCKNIYYGHHFLSIHDFRYKVQGFNFAFYTVDPDPPENAKSSLKCHSRKLINNASDDRIPEAKRHVVKTVQ